MKIKAKYYNQNVTIIAFINITSSNIVKVVYINEDGRLGTCHLDGDLTVIDKEYLPIEESRVTGWCDMRE